MPYIFVDINFSKRGDELTYKIPLQVPNFFYKLDLCTLSPNKNRWTKILYYQALQNWFNQHETTPTFFGTAIYQEKIYELTLGTFFRC